MPSEMFYNYASACASALASLSAFLPFRFPKLPPVHTTTGKAVKILRQPSTKVATVQPLEFTIKPANNGPTIHPAAQAMLNRL